MRNTKHFFDEFDFFGKNILQPMQNEPLEILHNVFFASATPLLRTCLT